MLASVPAPGASSVGGVVLTVGPGLLVASSQADGVETGVWDVRVQVRTPGGAILAVGDIRVQFDYAVASYPRQPIAAALLSDAFSDGGWAVVATDVQMDGQTGGVAALGLEIEPPPPEPTGQDGPPVSAPSPVSPEEATLIRPAADLGIPEPGAHLFRPDPNLPDVGAVRRR